ncbi:hypothetical protein [Parasphingorhabdus halotolerans]|uniref:Uncharacterized protein n=1 Tax=Parasphingorhabdus halotolerans TaxID=2725558 RepID=A0A6H2DLQ1_9SPHN|nr:hypothetical protein [Parasphingorhabdus halotolerans]QJB68586.1 hypothetical protein HF685_04200 [Parasphingorhabdus halotolerans]
MFKEAAALVVSVGLLTYLFTPVEKEDDPAPVEVESIKTPKAKASKNYQWEVDDGDDAEEEFVFGEPMVSTDINYEENSDEDNDNDDSKSEDVASASRSNDTVRQVERAPEYRGPVHPDSPKPGQRGSAENPIALDQ